MPVEIYAEADRLEETKAVLHVITSRMVLPLYFVFWACDLLYVPHLAWEFLGLRGLVIPLAAATHFFLLRAHTFKYVQNIALGYVLFLSYIINVMILMIGDPATPYYAGLNLVAIGTLSFIPWTTAYGIAAMIGIFAPYYVITLAAAKTTPDFQMIAVHSFFMISTITITWVVRVFRNRLRERELRSRQDLIDEIKRRQLIEKDLIRARDDLLAAYRAKSSFLANMSHELRTPLNAIIGYSEILLEDAELTGTSEHTSELTRIRKSGEHLLALINDILSMSKIEAGKMEMVPEEFDVPTFVEDVSGMVDSLAGRSRNDFRLSCPADIGSMTTDPMRLRQVLLNLLSNAFKFTENGVIALNVSATEQELIAFEVSDTGVGITKEDLGKLFLEFSQLDDSPSRAFGGTGLGLAISKNLVRLMGGEITVQSERGKGSAFRVLLPRRNYFESDIETESEDTMGIDSPL